MKTTVYNGYEPVAPAVRTMPVDGRVRLGFLGRLEPKKGIEVLLNATAELRSKRWELWIAGRGEDAYEAALRERWSRSQVHFLGHTSPETLFGLIDVLVVPSLWNEPFGMVVIEAYASGVPVIGSTRGGLREIIDYNGGGLVFEPTDPGSLTRVLGRVIEKPDTLVDLGRRAAQRSKEFRAEQMVNRYLNIYNDLRQSDANI